MKITMGEVTNYWWQGRKFKHPATGHMVNFKSLPLEEQKRLNALIKQKPDALTQKEVVEFKIPKEYQMRKANVNEFVKQMRKVDDKWKKVLSWYSPKQYQEKNIDLHISNNKRFGYGITPEGHLISVFSLDKGKGYGKYAVQDAIKNGAKSLDCFDIKGFLPQFYSKYGFKETHRSPNWQADGPDYVEMSLGKAARRAEKLSIPEQVRRWGKEDWKDYDEVMRDVMGDVQCLHCTHYHGDGTCDAFTDGIPKEVGSTIDHSKSVEGDNGIVFEEKE
jgi:hypothetical protein